MNLGKFPVRHNVELRDRFGHLSQIDLTYGLLRPRYVECKCYSASHKVPLEDVAKFAYVLTANGIAVRRGLFVTSSTYKPRAMTVGIECWDIQKVEQLERRVWLFLVMRLVVLVGSGFALYWLFQLLWERMQQAHDEQRATNPLECALSWMFGAAQNALQQTGIVKGQSRWDKNFDAWRNHMGEILDLLPRDASPLEKARAVPLLIKLIVISEMVYKMETPAPIWDVTKKLCALKPRDEH